MASLFNNAIQPGEQQQKIALILFTSSRNWRKVKSIYSFLQLFPFLIVKVKFLML